MNEGPKEPPTKGGREGRHDPQHERSDADGSYAFWERVQKCLDARIDPLDDAEVASALEKDDSAASARRLEGLVAMRASLATLEARAGRDAGSEGGPAGKAVMANGAGTRGGFGAPVVGSLVAAAAVFAIVLALPIASEVGDELDRNRGRTGGVASGGPFGGSGRAGASGRAGGSDGPDHARRSAVIHDFRIRTVRESAGRRVATTVTREGTERRIAFRSVGASPGTADRVVRTGMELEITRYRGAPTAGETER